MSAPTQQNIPPSRVAGFNARGRSRGLKPAARWVPALRVLAVCAYGLAVPAAVRADQIVVESANYTGARVTGMEDGRLRFRSADGGLHNVWLDEVRLIIVDRPGVFDDFNQAEQFLADGDPESAIARYRRALRPAEDFWGDVIATRLLIACDAAGQLDNAVLSFIRVASGTHAGGPAAARLMPTSISDQRTARAQRAVEQLDSALSKKPDEVPRTLFELLKYEILRRTGDARAELAVPSIVALSIPAGVRTPGVFTIQLHALRRSLADGIEASEWAALDRAIGDGPETALPDFLLLKGEALLGTATTREDLIRAAWPFLRVAVHFPDDPRGAEGLLGAATAMERMGRMDKAAELLGECLAHRQTTEPLRERATAVQARLQGASNREP